MLGFFLPAVLQNLSSAAAPDPGTGPTYFAASVVPRDVPASPDVPSFASVRVEPA